MYITVSVFAIVSITTVSLMTGFWVGRSLRWKMVESQEEAVAGPEEAAGAVRLFSGEVSLENTEETEDTRSREPQTRFRFQERRRKSGEKIIPKGWAIGSPCAGDVNFFYEGSRQGAVIETDKGLVYAPASGKITKLYPMGNAFLLRTDFGTELLIKAGSHRDDMLSRYYRPRIVQNEIVNKGKLLLEFDLEKLKAEGVDAGVSISVEAAEEGRDVLVTGQKHVRVGEELLWVREKNSLA
nr:PTS glucose transporter subunit IIA [uncultured Acetatifactor sp.]